MSEDRSDEHLESLASGVEPLDLEAPEQTWPPPHDPRAATTGGAGSGGLIDRLLKLVGVRR